MYEIAYKVGQRGGKGSRNGRSDSQLQGTFNLQIFVTLSITLNNLEMLLSGSFNTTERPSSRASHLLTRTFGCGRRHFWFSHWWNSATGIKWVETRDAAKCIPSTGQPLTTENYLAQNVNSAEVKKPSNM